MHETQHPDVIGHIDSKEEKGNTIHVTGWCISCIRTCVVLRVATSKKEPEDVTIIHRPDVAAAYYVQDPYFPSGWEFTSNLPCTLQANLGGKWVDVFSFASTPIVIRENIPSYIVVDNFYENPDFVRQFALKCDFKLHPEYHKGRRTEECYKFDGLKEAFEKIIGKKIQSWDIYGTNGCFQYCIAGEQLVYHVDNQQYAGVLFLTPDAPIQSGTSLFRSRHTKKMKVAREEQSVVFAHGFLDPTEFEEVDRVGNVYNRLVLFDAQFIHAASEYFGNNLQNGRLFQLFFFDLEK